VRWLLIIAISFTTQMTCVPADARTHPPTLDELLVLPLERLVRLRFDPAAHPASTLSEKGGRHAP
jgi:hypothetical protein